MEHPRTPCFVYYHISIAPDECALHSGGGLFNRFYIDRGGEDRWFSVMALFQPVNEPTWPPSAMRNYVLIVSASVRNCMSEFQQAPMDLSNVARSALLDPTESCAAASQVCWV